MWRACRCCPSGTWSKGGKKSQAAIIDNVLEEGVDVIIIALSVLGAYKFTKDDIKDRMVDKLKKWERVMKKKK